MKKLQQLHMKPQPSSELVINEYRLHPWKGCIKCWKKNRQEKSAYIFNKVIINIIFFFNTYTV